MMGCTRGPSQGHTISNLNAAVMEYQ
jgi:hypothetical protein